MADESTPVTGESRPAVTASTAILGAYLVVLAGLLIFLVYAFWPEVKEAAGVKSWVSAVPALGFGVTAEQRLIILVLLVGALGSYIHVATSFSSYIGNRTFRSSWIWWYVLRPFVGGAMALLFYFLIRGGFLTSGAVAADEVNLYGFVAIAGLAGMFSKQASDKLREVFDNLFQVNKGQGDDQRGDKLIVSKPIIEAIDPKRVPAGGQGVSIVVSGRHFAPKAVVEVNGSECETTVHSNLKLTAKLDDSAIANAGDLEVVVKNPDDAGGASETYGLTVAASPDV